MSNQLSETRQRAGSKSPQQVGYHGPKSRGKRSEAASRGPDHALQKNRWDLVCKGQGQPNGHGELIAMDCTGKLGGQAAAVIAIDTSLVMFVAVIGLPSSRSR